MPVVPTQVPAPVDAARAVEWTTAIEQLSADLPRPRGIARYRKRRYHHNDRVAVRAGFSGSDLFVDPATGASLLVKPASGTPLRADAVADVIVAGAMRTKNLLRFRAFYVSAARTLAVHRRHGSAPPPLQTGSAVQRTLAGRIPLVVPRVFDSGFHRAVNADWVVEEALDGVPILPPDATSTAHELLALLAETWQRLGTTHTSLDVDQRTRALSAFRRLTEDPPDGIWPADVDRQTVASRVHDLLTSGGLLTVGLSHGDPGLGNVLRLTDGRLALVDWEDAGRRPVAHDVMKVVMSVPDPLLIVTVLDDLPPPSLRRSATPVLPWRLQVATAIVLFLAGWHHRHTRAVRRGSTVASRRRMHAMVRTLDALLGVGSS